MQLLPIIKEAIKLNKPLILLSEVVELLNLRDIVLLRGIIFHAKLRTIIEGLDVKDGECRILNHPNHKLLFMILKMLNAVRVNHYYFNEQKIKFTLNDEEKGELVDALIYHKIYGIPMYTIRLDMYVTKTKDELAESANWFLDKFDY